MGLCMDYNNIRKLAGINESASAHLSQKGFGAYGAMLILEDSPFTAKLAQLLGVPDGWELTPILTNGVKVYGAYSKGDRLSIFEHMGDFEPN